MALLERAKRPALFFNAAGPGKPWDERLSWTREGTVTVAGC
jgi:hypothetical protein